MSDLQNSMYSSEQEEVDFVDSMRIKSYRTSQRSVDRLHHNAQISRSSWHGMAFIIEAVILLAFIAAAIAVFFQLFAHSEQIGISGQNLSGAITYASNTAELFSSDPASMEGYTEQAGNYVVSCTVAPDARDAGTLYNATITVKDVRTDAELYTLTTSCYESNQASEVSNETD